MAADDPIPFILQGVVVSWDPDLRILYLGTTRLVVAPGVDTALLAPSRQVTVAGYRSRYESGQWLVMEVRSHRLEF